MADIEEEPLFALSEADLAMMNAEKTLVDFALTTCVSEEVRRECTRELEEAKNNHYRISKHPKT
jgi:hypothetical protein